MKLTASLVVMSHLSDAQEMIGQPNPQWANDNINFAKFLIMKCLSDLTQEVDADELWSEFVNSKFYKG